MTDGSASRRESESVGLSLYSHRLLTDSLSGSESGSESKVTDQPHPGLMPDCMLAGLLLVVVEADAMRV